ERLATLVRGRCHPRTTCGISSAFAGLFRTLRQVAHVLLTRPPLAPATLAGNWHPFDLHVSGTPPALILSQDQTLRNNLDPTGPRLKTKSGVPTTFRRAFSEKSVPLFNC